MLSAPWIAGICALFVWWFSTGAILIAVRWADRLGGAAPQLATVFGLPLLAGGIWAIQASVAHDAVWAVYLSFAGAVAVWGWIELAFLTGVVTGPNARDCPARVPEWERFIRAWGTIAYHEIALAGTLIALALHAEGQVNRFGFLTFAVLFAARISAKLNLFLGVPKINTEFLPRALAHLPSHFRISPVSWLFPISVTALSCATACWLERLVSATDPSAQAGFALLTAMTALALIEHWFMVLALPDEKLWRWMLPAPRAEAATRKDLPGH